MPGEKGQPLPGEWWETRQGGRAYVAALLPDTSPIPSSPHSQLTGWLSENQRVVGGSWSRKGEWVMSKSRNDLVKHLPDCTGWDWQPPDWVELDPVNYGWHVLRANIDQCRHRNEEAWLAVAFLEGNTIEAKKGNWQFRCLRKDLPQKPPELAVTSGGPYVSIEVHEKVVAERDALRARMREIEAKAKFYESVM